MASLKLYTVHIKPDSPAPYDAPIFVEEGFNIWAFVFTGFWALYYSLWVPALMIFLAMVGIDVLADAGVLGDVGAAIVQVALSTIVGFSAGDWQRARLRKQGYIIADIASGENVLRAQQRFFDRYVTRTQHTITA